MSIWYNRIKTYMGGCKMAETYRKLKIIGKEEYINHNTGEIEEMQVMRIEERDANFHKLWLEHILHSLNLIGNQKTRLAFWLLDNLDSENKITMTYRQMAEKSGIGYQTVQQTMTALLESDFIVRINGGAYRINPNIIFKGGKTDRLNVLVQYREEKQ